MSKLNKIIYIILMTLIILTLSINNIYARHGGGGGTHAAITSTKVTTTIDPDDYEPPEIKTKDISDAMPFAQRIVGIITVIGIVASVITIMLLGMKYMVGSIEERAEYKRTMIPILIGIILIVGTSWIISLIYNIVPSNI